MANHVFTFIFVAEALSPSTQEKPRDRSAYGLESIAYGPQSPS